MPNPRSSRSSASPSPGSNGATPSPSRQSETQIEVLYNQAVQSFVRKDHIKTQAILSRLLKLLEGQSRPTERWYQLGKGGVSLEARDSEEWTIKTLKLLISSHASLYADQTSAKGVTDPPLSVLLNGPPSGLLEHLRIACHTALHTTSEPLPPALLSTLVLASLKMKPSVDSLNWAHHLAEEWITSLDATFIDAISRPLANKDDAEQSRKAESAREGYIKVIELFVGEVLAREGEWEMARAFLEGEVVMGSKRRENLYRHLRSMETKYKSSSSPASSAILPSPSSSGILPPQSPTRQRSRSGSASSSSSEATARPAADNRLSSGTANGHTPVPHRHSGGLLDRKGKNKATDAVSESSASTMPQPLPDKFVIHHGNGSGSRGNSNRSIGGSSSKRFDAFFEQLRSILPSPVRSAISRLPLRWLGVALPLPILLVAIMLGLRRRKRRALVQSSPAAIGGAYAAPDTIDVVRDRLREVRAKGLWEWMVWWFKWWMGKFVGVWKMGTTITYV